MEGHIVLSIYEKRGALYASFGGAVVRIRRAGPHDFFRLFQKIGVDERRARKLARAVWKMWKAGGFRVPFSANINVRATGLSWR